MEILKQIIGFFAAAIGTSLMLPQVIKTIRLKQADDISSAMLALYFLNCLLWLVYGSLIQAWPVIVCNFIALLISIVQLALKKMYSKK